MDIAQALLGNLITILALSLIVAGVIKIFQVATTVNEIKELVQDLKRENSIPAPVPASHHQQSGEEMLRALSEIQEPAVKPVAPAEFIQPRS